MPHTLSPDPTVRRRSVAAQWTTCLLVVCLAAEAGVLVSGFSQLALLAPAVEVGQPLPDDLVASHARLRADAQRRADARHRAAMVLQAAALVTTAILWLIWVRGAYGSLALVGTKRMRFSRRWAVGCWFVPFVNLVRSYQVMKDLWLRSDSRNDRDGYDRLPAPTLLRAWWGACVAWSVLAPVGFTTPDVSGPSQRAVVTELGIVLSAVEIVATVLAINVVREIERRQRWFE